MCGDQIHGTVLKRYLPAATNAVVDLQRKRARQGDAIWQEVDTMQVGGARSPRAKLSQPISAAAADIQDTEVREVFATHLAKDRGRFHLEPV